NVCLNPKEALRFGNWCPVCKRQLTIGVLHRVEQLADRPEGYVPKGAIPFKSLIPLTEIIGGVLGIEQLYSKRIWEIYNKLIERFGSEFCVLLEAEKSEMRKVVDEKIAKAIIDVREGKVEIRPGYDGVYGYPVFEGVERFRKRVNGSKSKKPKGKNKSEKGGQKSLMEF
ncbi:MAG: DNA helicase UvrD, partial [Candidatus Aenigmatarchaeota archaeon]